MPAFLTQQPVLVTTTREVADSLDRERIREASEIAFIAVVRAAETRGLTLAHVPVRLAGVRLAASSVVRTDGRLEIRLALGHEACEGRVFSEADLRIAMAAAERNKESRQQPRRWDGGVRDRLAARSRL